MMMRSTCRMGTPIRCVTEEDGVAARPDEGRRRRRPSSRDVSGVDNRINATRCLTDFKCCRILTDPLFSRFVRVVRSVVLEIF